MKNRTPTRARLPPQVVALPPVDAVINGQVQASDIYPNSNKVDIWALGVTLFELVTGGKGVLRGGGMALGCALPVSTLQHAKRTCAHAGVTLSSSPRPRAPAFRGKGQGADKNKHH